ncbi:MAG: Regulatory protein [Alphaproteobacteria bacterium]|nr:Regulatory protein [Alphaproteobacteria bacterium]
MPRSLRPILDVASGNLMLMIALHQDKPCPTNGEIMEWTGVARSRLNAWLDELVVRGILEVQRKGLLPPRRRRLRAVGGSWTGWTARRRSSRGLQ